ncbi:hypothetical protein CO669_00545 [Bradyrhizobium sp. Y36]|uniref:hypothetical protein n=1 Tax=Bradyrhizobium sp. Y36 TaxID=2035447 RepID=UPI000BE836CC|nr:hypothetical protein [Bradyrhizobium sp. Y36]PDT91812.1 hypothetical protein CO669_00545 [Bradyrhizobium sp. Y36]
MLRDVRRWRALRVKTECARWLQSAPIAHGLIMTPNDEAAWFRGHQSAVIRCVPACYRSGTMGKVHLHFMTHRLMDSGECSPVQV